MFRDGDYYGRTRQNIISAMIIVFALLAERHPEPHSHSHGKLKMLPGNVFAERRARRQHITD